MEGQQEFHGNVACLEIRSHKMLLSPDNGYISSKFNNFTSECKAQDGLIIISQLHCYMLSMGWVHHHQAVLSMYMQISNITLLGFFLNVN